MSSDPSHVDRSLKPAVRVLLWAVLCTLLTLVVLLAGIGLVAVVGRRGDDSTWARWSSVGEAFGVLNSVVAGLALAALMVTFLTQFRELKAQRDELGLQRRTLQGVEFRSLHVSLIGMAINDQELAEVWPATPETDARTRRQHLYANLLLQNVWLQYTEGIVTRDEMTSNLRYMFTSPRIRAFWRATAASRANLYVTGTQELNLASAADEIYREYEAVLAHTDGVAHRTVGTDDEARDRRRNLSGVDPGVTAA